MRLVSFELKNKRGIGLLRNEGIVDLAKRDQQLPTGMVELLQAGPDAIEVLTQYEQTTADYLLEDVHLLSPIPNPGKILGIGLNYKAHAAEGGAELPEVPLVFTKQNSSINGPYDPVHKAHEIDSLDYEGELAIIIGKRCRRVPRDKASQVIAGYSVGNDVSVREWQFRGAPPQFTMGKSWDTHCPLGPAIQTQINPHNCALTTSVNGEIRQRGNTNDLIFNCYEIVEYVSTAFTLEPGDIILTGTPGGVGIAMDPPSYLQVGDIVRVNIEGIGFIENEIQSESGGRPGGSHTRN